MVVGPDKRVITGTSGDDALSSGDEAAIIRGLAGNDILDGGGGDDYLEGGTGFDQLDGGTGTDYLYGGSGDDVLIDNDPNGGAGNDQLYGEDGWDTLTIIRQGVSGPTQVLIDGGAGPDVVTFTDATFTSDATLIGGDGDDMISAFRGHSLAIDAGAGNDRVALFFLGADTTVTLGAGRDFLALNAYDGLAPAGGGITVTDFEVGDQGDRLELLEYLIRRLPNWDPATNPFATQHLRLVQDGADTLLELDSDGAGGSASFASLVRLQHVNAADLNLYNLGGWAGDGAAPAATTIQGTAGLDLLWGTGGADLIQGLGSQDEIFGGAGNDRIEGGDGDDLLNGQYGDDILFGDAGVDNIIDEMGGNDQMFGGSGTDYLVVLRKDSTPISNVLLDGGDGDDFLDFNALFRTDRATLIGGNGDDSIKLAGEGEVIVDAGAGADHVSINYSNAHVDLTLGDGADEVSVGADFGFGAFLTLAFNDFAAGDFADSDALHLSNYLSHWLPGWDGAANPFEAGYLRLVQSGADTLLTVDRDTSGPEEAHALITFRNLAAETLTAFNFGGMAPGGIDLRGTEGDDVLSGGPDGTRIDGLGGDDQLYGNGGDDALYGNAGNDALSGGAGKDAMYGGLGNDTYSVDDAGDQVFEYAGEGNDRIAASLSYALAAGSEVETIAALVQSGTAALDFTGNGFAQTIIGNAGANLLTGGGGMDYLVGLGDDDILVGNADAASTLEGGTGDDWYYVSRTGDSVIEAAGQGNDRILTSVSYTVSAGQEIETLSAADPAATTALGLAGNALAQVISGNAGANVLTGGGGNDYLVGLGGDDILIGNADAASTLQGGTGNDWYYITRTGDSLVEFAGEGNDRILTSVSYTLSAGQEIETLSALDPAATSALGLTGNALAQVINGNAGANLLVGGGGGDYLVGLGGDDIFVGNADAASTLQGGTGDDWYYVSRTGDSIVEFAGEGNDRILTSVSYTLSAGQEIETLSAVDPAGNAAIDLAGNGFGQGMVGTNGTNLLFGDGGADDLAGLGGDDILLGGDGDDILNGGAGHDVLDGGAGADLLVFADALGVGNVDTIQSFVSGQDRILVENAVFTGLATGVLSSNAFTLGTAAQDADDRILYDSATGNLYFDADGNGAGAAMLFATLQGHPAITAGDFQVI